MRKRAIFTAVVMLCAVTLLLGGCANIPQPLKNLFRRIPDNGTIQINWTMKGTVVNGDGTFVESVPVTIRGEIQDHYPETDEAQFNITLFNNYKKRCPELEYYSLNRAVDGLPYYFFRI